MLASQRKQQILQILTEEKQVMSGELSQRFNVSEDSIRRDLRELAAEGKLQRVHGGALPVSAAIAPIETRKSVQIASKQAVARAAAALIQPGQVVIVDGGTTTAAMIGFTRRPQLHGGHPQPGHRRGAGGPPANRGDPARRQSIQTFGCRRRRRDAGGNGADQRRSVLYGGDRRPPAGGFHHR